MPTKDYNLPFKDNKHITSVDADNGQYNNLNLNSSQQQQPSIPLFKHQKIVLNGNKNVGNYGETNVTNSNDSYTTKGSSSSNYSKKDFRSIDLNNVSKKENGFSKNDSNNKNNSTLSLHIRAHEKAATVPVPFDSLKIKHKNSFFAIKWEKAKQIFSGCKPVIQNPFEFPRQEEENQQKKPYIIQFKASQQLLGSNRSLAKKGRAIAGNDRRSYISAAALSEAIKKVNNGSFVRSVENELNQKFDKLFFNEYDILGDLFTRYFASYIKQYRHPGYNVYFNAVQVNTNGNNSDNNAENSAENNEVIYQRLKVYKGRLSRMEILEILDLFRKGLLVQSAIFSQIFTKLCYKDTDIEAATMCVKCRKLFANSKSARTSHREHIKWHANNPEGDVIIPVTLKTLLIDCLADMISKDVFPFTVIEKPGFVNVLNTVFQRAFEYGLENGMNGNIPSVTPSIHDFLPCPNTLRNHVDSIVTTLTPEFSNYVKHHVETYGAAVSFDFTEKNSPYYVVTIHFLTKDWNLEHWSLEFGEYGGPNSNSDMVLEQFLEVMGHHGITPEMVKRQIVICTDRGSNMLAAFVDFERIDDVCHQLSILSKRIPDPYKNNWLPQDFRLTREVVIALQGVSKLLKDVTKIIKGINSRLKLKKKLAESDIYLAKHNEIRWLSRFRSIKSFLKLFADDKTDVREFVLDTLYEHKIGTQYIYRDAINNVNDNLDTLTYYIDLIRPIKNAVIILESETVPTINQILLQYHEIEEHFKECLTHESLIMQQMAASGIVALSYHKTITSSFSDYHTLALLLDPLKKDKIADIVGPENLVESIALFKRYLRKYEDNPADDQIDDAMAASPFAQFTTLNIDPLNVEAESYLKLKSQSVEAQYHDVLDFWRAQEEKYPRVAKLARRILPIVSSASSERQFSLLGRTLTPTRSSMSPQTVSNLINAKNLKRFKEEQEAKKAREAPNNIKVNHVMAKEKAEEKSVSCIRKNVPKDSIAIKKGSGETQKPKQTNDERQLVPAQTIKLPSEIDAVSKVQGFLKANLNYAKDIEKFAKTLQEKQQKSESENEESEEENVRKKMEKRDHYHGHHRNNNNDNGIIEQITVKRKIYQRNNIFSSTIDDSLHKLDKLGIPVVHDNRHNNHHHRHHQQNRRRSPTTPTIREVSSSAASSSSSFESEEYVEEPRQQRSPDKHRNGRKNNSDHRQSSVEATNMPDHFDDDDLSSDPETPPRREHRRQRVAERFENRRR